MARLKEFTKAILAGIMISIGAMVYLSCENKIVGAFLFSVGLITVVMFGFNLYTGKIGYVLQNNKIFLLDTVLSIFGNMLGCLIAALIKLPFKDVLVIAQNKLNKDPLYAFIDAVFCGILIFVCVDIYNKKNTMLGIIFCIPTFIICGFEHCVANMFYIFNARIFTINAFLFIFIIVVGNAVGGLLIPLAQKFYLNNKN